MSKENSDGHNCQEFYDCVKQDPNAIVKDVGEAHPFIIHEADAVLTLTNGSEINRTLYLTFEYVKKHLKEFKACPCEHCSNVVASYRVNRQAMRALQRGATPEEIKALIPNGWVRQVLQ